MRFHEPEFGAILDGRHMAGTYAGSEWMHGYILSLPCLSCMQLALKINTFNIFNHWDTLTDLWTQSFSFPNQTLHMSVFVSFDKALSSCLHWLLADEPQWYTWGLYSCRLPPRNTLGPLWWGMSPFKVWTRWWKHVNNPESVGASLHCWDHPTKNTSSECKPKG